MQQSILHRMQQIQLYKKSNYCSICETSANNDETVRLIAVGLTDCGNMAFHSDDTVNSEVKTITGQILMLHQNNF